VAKFPHVIGFDTFNEPSAGLVGKNVDEFPETLIPPGLVFKPAEAMAVAAGLTLKASYVNQIAQLKEKHTLVNEQGESAWLKGRTDTWQVCVLILIYIYRYGGFMRTLQ
jgi:hypothetical protein